MQQVKLVQVKCNTEGHVATVLVNNKEASLTDFSNPTGDVRDILTKYDITYSQFLNVVLELRRIFGIYKQ